MPSAFDVNPSSRIRRPRITTACTTCRDRRVKCDRARPACSQCTKGEKRCTYTNHDKPKLKFVNQDQHPGSLVDTDDCAASPSGTWNSVIDNQADIIKKSEAGDPVWAVAEAEEASRSQILQLRESIASSWQYVIPIEALSDHFVCSITNHFPSREVCQPFFESFLLGIYPIVPVCHVETLRSQYDNFWDTISPSYSVESLVLVLAVLYTGAANSSSIDTSTSSTFSRLYEEIFEVVDFASYHPRNASASIQLLQGYVIMSTYKASLLAPFSAFGFLPQIIRFAQSLRLHTEGKERNPIEIEVRRRLWWHLLSLDIESTIATGLPTIIHPTGYTTQLPRIRHDHAMIPTNELASDPYSFCPMIVAIHGHYQWAHRMQTWFEILPSREEVSNFENVIQSLVGLIPHDKASESEWVRTYLKMQVDRAYCMLGLRFWQLDQYKGTGCHSEVVETARSFLTHYLHLATLPTTTHFSWFVPGLIQPIHALIILLMHLSTCPSINDEELSRHLLDQIMSLRVDRILKGTMGPGKALLRGHRHPRRANPRYLIMIELRKRVWKKVGWDSDGKGKDPWVGTTVQGETIGGGDVDPAPDSQLGITAPDTDQAILEDVTAEWNTNQSTGLDGLDNLLAGDPMDLFQWDEWESLASEFFAS